MLNRGECEYLFMNSFYSLSGAMGTLDTRIQKLVCVRTPLLISGEPGTGKEQIARYLYLHSSMTNRPMVVINWRVHDRQKLELPDGSLYFALEQYR